MYSPIFLLMPALSTLILGTVSADNSIDLTAVRGICPGAPIPMPSEVFPAAYRQKLMAQKNTQINQGLLQRADEYLKTPPAVWRDRIPVRSCIGYIAFTGGTEVFNATCPACLRPARFGKVDLYGGTVTMDCCGAVFYEDSARYPADARGKPNKVMRIPHMDGTVVDYPYYEFPDRFPTDQSWQPWSPADGTRKHQIFLPDSYIRGKRLGEIVGKVIPDLGWAYFHTGDDKYARLLAAILDRLADLYPGWPLWINYSGRYGFALNRAENGVLTREEFESAQRPMRWGNQFWNTWDRSYCFGHTKMGALLPQYDMGNVAVLSKAYAAIRGSAAAKAYSQEKYGDPARFDQHVMKDLFGEMVKLFKCYEPWLGNYTQAWFEGGVYLSLLTQDRYFFDCANELMERSLYDECYADNATTQGSCSYWSMVFYPLIQAFKLREELYDPDVKGRHPRLNHLPTPEALQQRLTSWRWIIPAFGDTWNDLYPTGTRRDAKDPKDFVTTHFTDYGVSMLRWGAAEGRRQETCMVYQRVAGHTHNDALNLELFVDGLPVFWDMGYGNGTLDTDVQRHPEMKEIVEANWPRPVFDTSHYYQGGKGAIPSGHWWSDEWTHRSNAHCTVMVDELEPVSGWSQPGSGIPVTIMSATSPDQRLMEVLDIDEKGVFQTSEPKVSEYRRTLLTIQTPDGGGYMVDIFRVTGGEMHEFYYHAISEKADTNLPEGKALPGTLASYRETISKQSDRMKEIENPQSLQTTGWSKGYRHINNLKRIEQEPDTWRLRWEYDPALYSPRTKGARDNVADLLQQQQSVSLTIHGIRQTGTEQQASLWRARGLLTGHLREQLKDGTRLGGAQSNVGFVGGLDMLIEERHGEENLTSVFTHVLEGHRADLPDEVTEVRNLICEKAPDGAVTLRVKLADGHTDYIFCLPDNGEAKGKDFYFAGCYGLVRTDSGGRVVRSTMIRGSTVRLGKHELKALPEFSCEARRFEGDLTGDRSRSAVVVRCDKPLPEGTTLAGNPINLTSPDGWTDVYFMESIKALGKGEWRISLKGDPTFILDFLTVGDADDKDPHAFYPMEKDLSKALLNALYMNNVTLMRLSDGKIFSVDVKFVQNPDWRERIVLRDPKATFADSGLKRGDKAIVLRRQTGDKVLIPIQQTYVAR